MLLVRSQMLPVRDRMLPVRDRMLRGFSDRMLPLVTICYR